MTSKFLTALRVHHLPETNEWELDEPLVYSSERINRVVTVPRGFKTDFASVPRLPFAFMLFGDRAQEEAVVHDFLYRTGLCSRRDADAVFLEAMKLRGKGWWIRYPMWLGVRSFGWMFREEDQ